MSPRFVRAWLEPSCPKNPVCYVQKSMSAILQALLALALPSLQIAAAERIHRTGHHSDTLQTSLLGNWATMEGYLAADRYSKYVERLDPMDAAMVRSVSAVEKDWSGQIVLYHTTSPYIFFLAWLLNGLLHERPVAYDLRQPTSDTGYAMVNVTFRAVKASAQFPSTPPSNFQLDNKYAAGFSEANLSAHHIANVTDFLHRAQDLGALSSMTFDHLVGVRERLLSTNPNLFGNCDYSPGECSWDGRLTWTSWAPNFGAASNFLDSRMATHSRFLAAVAQEGSLVHDGML